MPVMPDSRYDATVIDCGLTESKEKQTPAIWFSFKTEDGNIDHFLWVTPNTSGRVAETMAKCFGVTDGQLRDMAWLDGMGESLRGFELSITTISEEKQDRSGYETKVQWMNPRGFPKKPASPMTKARVTQLFGAPSVGPLPGRSADDGPPPFAPVDDDVPF